MNGRACERERGEIPTDSFVRPHSHSRGSLLKEASIKVTPFKECPFKCGQRRRLPSDELLMNVRTFDIKTIAPEHMKAFLWVYDTFSLFLRRFSPREASCRVRTYRFCPFFACLRYFLTFSAAFLPARALLQSQNVSFLPVFHGFTILSHFFCGVSARAEPHAKSERIVFVHFLRVYDTFSLFPQRFNLRGASCKVRTYRFCTFFMGLRYVFTFPAAFLPARGLLQSQNVSFLSIFCVFTILSHFFCGVSARASPPAKSERIVFARFSWVYDTFSLFLRRFCPRGAPCRVRTYRFCTFFMGLRYVLTFSAAFLPARALMQSQNVSFLHVFYGFTIRSHFFCGVSACAGPHAKSERIVFGLFSWVYDTFSLRAGCHNGDRIP